jgi:sterol desaturase/sphingolipid hydroxylase (fatty acid hydroxylase superfamily)
MQQPRSDSTPSSTPSSARVSRKKVYPRDSVRLFKSDFLERFTHVHPAVPFFLWMPVVAVLFYRSFAIHELGVASFALLGFAGLLVWTFVEYVLHRFAFHYPAKSERGKRFVYIMHGLHHDDPVDPTRLVMPPLPALIYAALLFGIFRLFLGPVYVEPFFAFFMLGYLAYDYIHYYVHHFNPKNRVGKYLKRYHLIHHFTDHDAKWGVSNPLWDYVFGTVELPTHDKAGTGPQARSHST